MRTLWKMLAAVAAIAASFSLYLWISGGVGVRDPSQAPERGRMPVDNPGGGIGATGGVWVSQYNQDGRLSFQFRGEEFIPRPDDTIRVIAPQARFFMEDGRAVQVTAKEGLIRLAEQHAEGRRIVGGRVDAVPTKGELSDVRIDVLVPDSEEPAVSFTVNNATFDSERSRIYTDAFVTADGVPTPGDRVPVVVRGRDVEFDGQGLEIDWDRRNNRIGRLRIAHGSRMVIKRLGMGELNVAKPGSLSPGTMPQPGATAALTDPSAGLSGGNATTVGRPSAAWQTASEDGAADATLAPSANPMTPPPAGESVSPPAIALTPATPGEAAEADSGADLTIYRASFGPSVVVRRGDERIATGDLVRIDFPLGAVSPKKPKPSPPDASSSPKPATDPAVPATDPDQTNRTRPAAAIDAPKPSTAGADTVSPAAIVDTSDSSTPASDTASPTAGPDRTASAAGAATNSGVSLAAATPSTVVKTAEISGQTQPPGEPGAAEDIAAVPLTIEWDGPLMIEPPAGLPLSDLRSGQFAGELSGTPATMMYAGSTIECGTALFRSADESVQLSGADASDRVRLADSAGRRLNVRGVRFAGSAVMLEGDGELSSPAGGTDTLQASWSRSARVEFDRTSGKTQPKSLAVEGDVRLTHPAFGLSSERMGIGFDPALSQDGTAGLRRFTAGGGVRVEARGDPRGELTAANVVVNVDPPKQGVAARTMDLQADGDVRLSDPTRSLRSDRLVALLELGSVGGPPADAATTGDDAAGSNRDGPPNPNADAVAARVSAPAIGLPADVRLTVRKVVASGSVNVSAASQGSAVCDTLTATTSGQQVVAELVGTPAQVTGEQGVLSGNVLAIDSAKQTLAIKGPGQVTLVGQGKAPPVELSWQGGVQADLLGGVAVVEKLVKAVARRPGQVDTLEGDRVEVALTSAAAPADAGEFGVVSDFRTRGARSLKLTGDVRGESLRTDADGQTRFRVALRAPEVNYTAEPAKLTIPVAGRILLENLQESKDMPPGITAVGWSESLELLFAEGTGTMKGDVVVRHEPKDAKTGPMDLQARTVGIAFDPVHVDKPTGAVLRQVTASGPLRFVSKTAKFEAQELTFDPANRIVEAAGSDQDRARVIDPDGRATATFDRLRYDLNTDDLQIQGLSAGVRQ